MTKRYKAVLRFYRGGDTTEIINIIFEAGLKLIFLGYNEVTLIELFVYEGIKPLIA